MTMSDTVRCILADAKPTGETQRYTFRLGDVAVAQLDDLVALRVREDGSGDRTAVILSLIARAHAAIPGKNRGKNKSQNSPGPS